MPPRDSAVDLERVLERCKRSDQRAWAELVERFQRLVYSIPRRMGLTEDDAADVFQTTFVSLLRHLDRIEHPGTLPKWLSVTASRESLRLRRLSARTTSLSDSGTLTLDELIASEESSAEDLATHAAMSYEVSQAMKSISSRCRELLNMLYANDPKDYKQISAELGMPVGAIGPTRARCLEKLRATLERDGHFEEK